MEQYDIIIIGGGPAGMSAAIAAREEGIQSIVIIERDSKLGGILNQCIHNGFGLHYFGQELTGPEYAARLADKVRELNIEHCLDTMVLEISSDKAVTIVNTAGVRTICAKALILAMGCREKARGAINIPGSRPAGIYSAGTAQRYVNIEGYMPGKKVVVLGSGDIGLIMARRMVLEGAEVKAVCELLPYSSGLKRNIVQCLDDYNIPLLFNHTVTRIHGNQRLEGVTITEVDENKKPKYETSKYYECDCLLLSVGLIPENELSRGMGLDISPITLGPVVYSNMETSMEGVFAGGNVVHVHDLADNVTIESIKAGKSAAAYVKGSLHKEEAIDVRPGKGIRYVVPQRLDKNFKEELTLYLRVDNIYKNTDIGVYAGDKKLTGIRSMIFTPGEMVSIKLTKEQIENIDNIAEIVVEQGRCPTQ